MKYWPLVLLISLLALAAGCGGSSSPSVTTPGPSPETSSGPTQEPAATTPGQEPTAAEGEQGPVARVNGEEIAREEFNLQLSQLEASYQQQGVPFPQGAELQELRQQVVTQLVQQRLVLQESEARGITAEEPEVEEQYQQAVSSFPDEATFNQALEAQGLDQAEVEDLIADNIKVQKLLDAVIAEAQLAPPTEEELHELYDLASQQQQLPPFEEIRPQIEAEITNQREDEVLQAFVQDLEAAGTIEILLES